MGDSDVDAYVKKKADVGAYWLPKIVKTTRYNEGLISSAMRGYLSNWSNLKFGQVDTIKLKKEVALGAFRSINNSKENIFFIEVYYRITKIRNTTETHRNIYVNVKLGFHQKTNAH